MNSILVLGSGRSGTSMLTGMLANSGYHLGDNFEYLKKNQANPKGFFEDYEVNTVNEDILKESLLNMPEYLRKAFFPRLTFYRARWLARIPQSKRIKSNSTIDKKIEDLVNKPHFCYKDPRFSYTLPVWKNVFDACSIVVKYLVVYREPYKTAKSILRECQENKALHLLKMTEGTALKVWLQMYSHILMHYENDAQKENWSFIHFDQLFEEDKLLQLECFIGSDLDKDFPELSLSRTNKEAVSMPNNLKNVYYKLNSLSKYK